MTIPDVRLRLGQTYANADWKDATALVRAAQAVRITRGTPDERSVPDAATCQYTLENLDGKFTPRNPRSAYFDVLGMNVPTRVRTAAGSATTLPSVRAESETTTGNSTTITVALPAATAVGDILLVFHAYGSASQFTPTIDGVGWQRLVFYEEPEAYTAGGTAPYKNVVIWWKRVVATEDATFTLRQAGTYHGRVVALAIQNAGGFVPSIEWGQSATAGAGGADTDGNIQALPIRGLNLYTAVRWANVTIASAGVAGYTEEASVAGAANQPSVCIVSNDENDNEPWMNPAWEGSWEDSYIKYPEGPSAADLFTNGPYHFTAGINLIAADDVRYRAWAEVSGWPQKWTADGVDATVPVSSLGIFARYAKEPTRSPFERTAISKARWIHPSISLGGDLTGVSFDNRPGFAVWPLRENLSPLGRGLPGRVLNTAELQFGQTLSPGGDGCLPSGTLDAIALPFPPFRNWVAPELRSVGFTFAFDSDTTAATHARLKCNLGSDSTAATPYGQDLWIEVSTTATTFTVTVTRVRQDTGASAAVGSFVGTRYGGTEYHRAWVEWFKPAAGAGTYRLIVDGRPVSTGAITIYATGTGSPQADILLWADIPIGQVQAFAREDYSSLPPQWHDLWPATRGYIGETAAERIHRLCREERLSPEAYGERAENRNRLGAQPTGTLVDQLEDAALADGGMLYESTNRLGIAYRPRTDLYWSDVLTILYTDGDLQESPEPLEDDQTILNQVTYTGDGASYSQTETAGARGTLRAGVYARTGDISTFHRTLLAQRAAWDLYLGTLDEPRYRELTFNLRQMEANGHTTLAQSLREVKLGDRLRLTSMPVWIPPGPVDLLIQGIEETMTNLDHIITFNTRPASPFMPGIIGDSVAGAVDVKGQRVDASASTVGTTVDADDTTLSVVTSLASRLAAPWTVNGDDWDVNLNGGGLYIRVGGEVMQVTNIAADSSTIAHDAATESATFTTTTPHAFNHTPVGTPKAALVFISHGTPSTDVITSVSYGGVAMTRIGTAADTAGEDGRVYIYALTSGVLAGVQAVSIVHSGSATVKHAVAVTVTASGTLTVREVKRLFEDQANPQTTFTTIGATALHYSMLYSGQDAMASVAPLANMTAIHDHDFGAFVTSIDRETTSSQADCTMGYTVASEDVAFLAVELVNTTATQAFTVVRNVDDYAAAHTAGDAVNVAYPIRIGL